MREKQSDGLLIITDLSCKYG